jgi:hypothetical protein
VFLGHKLFYQYILKISPSLVAHAFNRSTREAEAGGSLSWRPAWSTLLVPGQPGLYRETLSRKTKNKKQKDKKQNKTKQKQKQKQSKNKNERERASPATIVLNQGRAIW